MAAFSRTALPARAMVRPRLVRRLAGSWKVAVLSAPAGYGKTTLSAQFAGRRRTLWLRVTPEHADPPRLMGALLAAAQRARPPIGGRTAALFASRRDWERDEGLLTGSLIDELVSHRAGCLVVLDDLHQIGGAGAARTWLRRVVEESGPRLRFLIACRGECPLPLSRLQAGSEVRTLGSAELAFTSGEQARFLARRFRLRLEEAENLTLHDRLGGWPAGVALAGRLGAARAPVSEATPSLARIHGPDARADLLERYLEEEVLAPLPADLRSDLERLALLDALDPGSARLALGRDPAAALAEVRSRDLFVLEGAGREPERFHALMRDALLSGFRRRLPEPRRAAAVRGAVAHFLEHGDSPRAIRLLLEAGLASRARELFDRAASGRAPGGEEASLGALAETLAGGAGGADSSLSPWIRLHRAHHAALEERDADARRDARAAREAFAARGSWIAAARAFRVEAVMAMREGRSRAIQSIGERAFGAVPARERRARAEIARTMSEIAQRAGDRKGSARWLDGAERSLGRSGTALERADLEVRRATLIYTEGRWEPYVEAVRRVLPLFRRAGYSRQVQSLLFNLAEASIYLGDETGAIAHLDEAAALEPRARMPDAPVIEAELRARAHSERGDFRAATRILAEARARLRAGGESFASLRLDVWEGILLRRRRRLAEAGRRLDRAIAGFARLDAPTWLGLARMERALVSGLTGRGSVALRELAAAARVSRRSGDARELARNALFEAAVREASGGDGHRPLRRALAALESLDYLVLLRKEADIARPLLEHRRPRPERRRATGPPAPPIAIGLLGGFRIQIRGSTVTLPRASSRTLIARLALARGHALRRETLAESLWPGAPAASSRNRLDVALHAARRALEPGAGRRGPFEILIVEGGWCRIDAARVAIDVQEFERLAGECEPALRRLDADPWRLAAGMPESERRPALARIETALESCRGPLLPEDGDRFTEERARIDERERRLRIAAGRLAHSLGRHAEAMEHAGRVLEEDPLNEAACHVEILVRIARGERMVARRRLRAFVRRTRRALGTAPGPELMALAAALEGESPLL